MKGPVASKPIEEVGLIGVSNIEEVGLIEHGEMMHTVKVYTHITHICTYIYTYTHAHTHEVVVQVYPARYDAHCESYVYVL
jgi:hypothetical protein